MSPGGLKCQPKTRQDMTIGKEWNLARVHGKN